MHDNFTVVMEAVQITTRKQPRKQRKGKVGGWKLLKMGNNFKVTRPLSGLTHCCASSLPCCW